MSKFKSLKSILLTISLTLGISLSISTNTFAATYTTISGDSLYKISRLFNTSTANLINDNNLATTTIYPGQVLYVSCKTYTVQSGDSLYLIGKKYGIAVDTIRQANNIWTDSINVGQKLNIPVSSTVNPTKPVTYSASDLDLLSRLINAEAQDQPYEAKVAVGAVVMNRVKSSAFPNSISGVIYQTINGYYQFTPVLNGWINKSADADSINAAKAALSGVDPTNGALFYFDDSITNKWLLAKPVSITIDNLIFAF
jgi:N-acetylmuramoyl-L-alanine amidase